METAKTLQIELDANLQQALQANAEAQKIGVPELVRRAVSFYLRRYEEAEIRQKYQKEYGEADLTDLEFEMKDWEDEQVWPAP